MRELIPSKDVRNYLQKLGRKFNDFECATLIYNSDWSLNEKYQVLTEILENTKDEVLRGQIQDRIERDKEYLAEGYASGCGRKCKIEVFELEKSVAWNEDNWGEPEIAYVLYDEQGEITYYWTETCMSMEITGGLLQMEFRKYQILWMRYCRIRSIRRNSEKVFWT